MPVLGLIIGGVDFSNIGFILRDADLYASVNEAVAAGAPVIQIGAFINTIINFLLIAIVLFFIVRSFNNFRTRLERKKEAEEAAPASATCCAGTRTAPRAQATTFSRGSAVPGWRARRVAPVLWPPVRWSPAP